MKKILVFLLALVMGMSVLGCSADNKSDVEYVKEKGKLVVGITEFAPMDYKDFKANVIKKKFNS